VNEYCSRFAVAVETGWLPCNAKMMCRWWDTQKPFYRF
jgi:hypothetical protein